LKVYHNFIGLSSDAKITSGDREAMPESMAFSDFPHSLRFIPSQSAKITA
jgi:hypothetical protein